MRLRPTGKSGSLALSLDEFKRYFGGTAQVWERLALTRARVVRGDGEFADKLMTCVREAVTGKCEGVPTAEVAAMRAKLEGSTNPRSLKRGRGGLADVEFAVQLLQLRHGRDHPEVLKPNVWEALEVLAAVGVLSEPHAAALRDGYSFLRFVEARLRIVTDRPGEAGPPQRVHEWRSVLEGTGRETGGRAGGIRGGDGLMVNSAPARRSC
jgi:[glutamine synthetase] adenylyltransferase / [glutamine synthetase]-adenylyl-L-tyrosine phosphorylase